MGVPPAGGRGDAPPILFRLAEKECAVSGAVQTCRPVPGALYPGGTENCCPSFGYFGSLSGVVVGSGTLLAPRVPLCYALPFLISGREIKRKGASAHPFVSFQGSPRVRALFKKVLPLPPSPGNGTIQTSSPPCTWSTLPPSSWGNLSSSQQVINTCPPAMRFRTNSCRRGSSSLSTSSSSSTGYSPVTFL